MNIDTRALILEVMVAGEVPKEREGPLRTVDTAGWRHA